MIQITITRAKADARKKYLLLEWREGNNEYFLERIKNTIYQFAWRGVGQSLYTPLNRIERQSQIKSAVEEARRQNFFNYAQVSKFEW